MNSVSPSRYKKWQPVSYLPVEEKLLRQLLENGGAVLFSKTGVTQSYCALSDPEEFTGNILFINPKFWDAEVYYSAAQEILIKAVGCLASENTDEAYALFNTWCLEEPLRLADAIWDEHCIFVQNYLSRALLNGGAKNSLQTVYPDFEKFDALQKYLNKVVRMLKTDCKEFEEKAKNIAAYRKNLAGSMLQNLSDEEFLQKYAEDKKRLLESYKDLKKTIDSLKKVPEMFGCTGFQLRGGKYKDIKGICRLVSVEEIAKKNWSVTIDDYV